MKSLKSIILTVLTVAMSTLTAQAAISVGAEQTSEYIPLLKGKRVALLSNHTGMVGNEHVLDIMLRKGVNVTTIFSPEHGFRGNADAGEHVKSSIDPKTGIPIASLYDGNKREPKKEIMAKFDIIVTDIQDVGLRFYTYYCTMVDLMNAAVKYGKEFMVLDRPNPLGGNRVEGCLVEDGFYSFVSQFKIPYLYGMTPGEMARYLNGERVARGEKAAKLTVVPLKGWKRSMTFDKTGMPWVLPSPHIPQPATAFYYPATGILGELYYVSIGVGYTLPFQLICADWIDADKFAARMNALNLPGTKFRPIHVKPFYGTGKGENLQGVQFYVDDVPGSSLTLIQFYAMQELAKLYPEKRIFDTATDKSRFDMFDKVCGTDKIRTLFSKNYQVSDMIDYWNKDADAFKEKAKKYYLYK